VDRPLLIPVDGRRTVDVRAPRHGDGPWTRGVIRKRHPPWVLWSACLLLIVANVFNIAADMGGMGDAMQMVTGVKSHWWPPFFAVLITVLLIRTSYRLIAKVFKRLTVVLFAYVITAFLARPDWTAVLRATVVPHIGWTRDYMAVIVGILGTTISPYLFFWQARRKWSRKGTSAGLLWPSGAGPQLRKLRTQPWMCARACFFPTWSCISLS